MLHVLGISFRSAKEEVREGLALTGAEDSELLASAREALPGTEALVLSTCNRTEFYLAAEGDVTQDWHRVLRAYRPTAPRLDDGCDRYHLTGAAAYRHLLRVACGLDSAVLGDSQVLGQVRGAVTKAQQAGTLRGVLAPVTASALRLGRQARAETEIGRGSPGIGAAVSQALVTRGVPPQARVLVLGSGEAARVIVRRLVKAGYGDLAVSSRNPARLAALAGESGAAAVPWDERDATPADVVVAATAAREPVVVAVGEGARLVIDAGFPRQVRLPAEHPADVVPLLALAQEADESAEARRSAVPAVEALVAAETLRWRRTEERAPVEQAIKTLHLEAERLTRHAATQLAEVCGVPASTLERALSSGVRRTLHHHVVQLRASAAR
jgi:glutamyl-tRNA reductase